MKFKSFYLTAIISLLMVSIAEGKSNNANEQAKRVINQALEKLGGAENLKSISSIIVKAKGRRTSLCRSARLQPR